MYWNSSSADTQIEGSVWLSVSLTRRLIFIVLAISIYMKNSYYVEGVENMFNDKGQFSDFILPEY